MTSNLYELTDGRHLPVVAEHHGHDYVAWVLHDVEAFHEWVLTWTDGINHWLEGWHTPEVVFARLAALVRACDQGTFLVHDGEGFDRARTSFEAEVERFLVHVVHASSCPSECDGTDPTTHRA